MVDSPEKSGLKCTNVACSTRYAAAASDAVIVVPGQEGEDGMGVRNMTVERYEEIKRRLAEGRGLREIARALNCSRDTVPEVRDGARQSPAAPRKSSDPLWMLPVGMASRRARSGARPSVEVHLGGEGPASHGAPQPLSTTPSRRPMALTLR
jgi:hypothetical protein